LLRKHHDLLRFNKDNNQIEAIGAARLALTLFARIMLIYHQLILNDFQIEIVLDED